MIVRALDSDHDWTFGKGLNDYKSNQKAIIQNIDTRLNSYLGNCFFDLGAGIDWFNLLGEKDQTTLNLAISTVILNTTNVTGMKQFSTSLSPSRVFTVQYMVNTTYSVITGTFTYNVQPV